MSPPIPSASKPIKAPTTTIAAPENKSASEATDRNYWEGQVRISYGPEMHRADQSGGFGTDGGAWSDGGSIFLSGSALRMFQLGRGYFGVGPTLAYSHQHSAGKFDLNQFNLGPSLELNWQALYSRSSDISFTGPKHLNLFFGVGYGLGTSQPAESPLLREQSGVSLAAGFDVNLFSVQINEVNMGLGFYARYQAIPGESVSDRGASLGGMFTLSSPFAKRAKDSSCSLPPLPDLSPTLAAIRERRAENDSLRAELEGILKELESGNPPITRAQFEISMAYLKALHRVVEPVIDSTRFQALLDKVVPAILADMNKNDIFRLVEAEVPEITSSAIGQAFDSIVMELIYGFERKILADPKPVDARSQVPASVRDAELLEERLHEELAGLKKTQNLLKYNIAAWKALAADLKNHFPR